MKGSLRVLLLIAVVAVVAWRLVRPRGREASASLPLAPPATLVLLAGTPGQAVTRLHRVPVGAETLPPALATIEHRADAVVRGALRGEELLVVADRAADASWGGSLLRVDGQGRVVELCDRVAHAARPLVTASGRVLVERGRSGEERGGQLRTDEITVDEIDPRTGEARALWRGRGYTAHLAAALGERVLVYHVDSTGAELLALDPGGAARPIAAVAPFARDFSVDGAGRLVLANRDVDADRWTIERIDLASGTTTRLWSGQSGHAAPHAVGGEVIAYNDDSDGGIDFLGDLEARHRRARAAFGGGVDVVLEVSPDGAWAALLHHPPEDRMPAPRLLRLTDGAAFDLPAERAVRYQPVGFLP